MPHPWSRSRLDAVLSTRLKISLLAAGGWNPLRRSLPAHPKLAPWQLIPPPRLNSSHAICTSCSRRSLLRVFSQEQEFLWLYGRPRARADAPSPRT